MAVMRARPGWLVVALAAIAVATAACRSKATRAECDAMVEHYLDLATVQDKDMKKLPIDQLAIAREMKKELMKGDKRFAQVELRCEAEVTAKERDCAIGASTVDEWVACIH